MFGDQCFRVRILEVAGATRKLTRLVGRQLLEVNCVKLRELFHHGGTEDTERAHASELTERSKFKRFASHEFAFETAASIILRGWAVSISFGAATDIRLPPAVYLIEGAVQNHSNPYSVLYWLRPNCFPEAVLCALCASVVEVVHAVHASPLTLSTMTVVGKTRWRNRLRVSSRRNVAAS